MRECKCDGKRYPLKETGYWLCIECGVQSPMEGEHEHLRA